MTQNERLHKYLARCGVSSRRKCEVLIAQGHVRVNGLIPGEPGTTIDPDRDVVLVDGKRVLPQELVVIAFYKPPQVLSAVEDASDRPTVIDLLPDLGVRLYPVGRLDFASEGLLLMSNDGDLTQRVLHPSYQVEREYEVKVKGEFDAGVLDRLRNGVELSDGPTKPARVSIMRRPELTSNVWLRFVITEGRNRIVRRMCEAVGLDVLRLRRTRIGEVRLGELKPGKFRHLNALEKESLLHPAPPVKKKSAKKKRPPKRHAGGERPAGGDKVRRV